MRALSVTLVEVGIEVMTFVVVVDVLWSSCLFVCRLKGLSKGQPNLISMALPALRSTSVLST